MSLVPCTRCNRHVREGEACPFCVPTTRGASLAVRALVGVLASGALVGCGGASAEGATTPSAPSESRPSEHTNDERVAEEHEEGTPDEAPAARPERAPVEQEQRPVAAYGGPPIPTGPTPPPR